ncbi:hypothetical protein VPH35_049648 [Triticum aestivum]|uniref:Uncharacterized protein n=1 Tax=Triticum aestivum TaxID=4565 RepID=A0A077RPX6_WHEAT|nr:unnamed protein product [Triticum aestivum]
MSRPRPALASSADAHVSSLLLLLPPLTVSPLRLSLPALSFLCSRRPSRHLPRTPQHPEPIYAASRISFPLVKIRQLTLARVLFDEMPQSGVRLGEHVYTAGNRATARQGISRHGEARGEDWGSRSAWCRMYCCMDSDKVSMVSYVSTFNFAKGG